MGYRILTGVWEEIDDELHRQRQKHGDKCMELLPTADAVLPLFEEAGEVAKAATEWRFFKGPLADVREELVQLAACAVAMVKHIDSGVELDLQRR